jgi:3-methyladenine DNA glycosylase Mpg
MWRASWAGHQRGATRAACDGRGVVTCAPHKLATAAHAAGLVEPLARLLVGKTLVRTLAEGMAGAVVETKAYGIGDPVGNAYRGITDGFSAARTRAFY